MEEQRDAAAISTQTHVRPAPQLTASRGHRTYRKAVGESCSANTEDVMSFIWSLPESEAQRGFVDSQIRPVSEIGAVVQRHGYPCNTSPSSPSVCDWVIQVDGPLFSVRYSIDPLRKYVRTANEEPYIDWCNNARARYSKWWPAGKRCDEIKAHAEEPLSPDAGQCDDP
jgi:hypothetical protein